MKIRTMLVPCLAVCLALLFIAAAVGWFMLPKDFELSDAWTSLRRNNLELATQIKNVIVQSDRDVAGIGEKRGLPLINIKFSRKDIAHFVDLYEKFEDPNFGVPYYAKHNLWRNAELTYEGQTYTVKVKSHGRNPTNHRSDKYISLAIKMPKGENINNSRRFSLLVRDHFVPKKQVIFDVADHFGVFKNQEELVRVKINNWDEKIFYFDRRLNEAFMEVEGHPSLKIFGYAFSDDSTNKSSIYTVGTFDKQEYRKRFKQTLTELEYPESQHDALTDRFVEFNQAIYEQRYQDLEEFCDMDYVSSFQAVRLITALIGHLARVDNFYVFYNTANGKFYPVITRDCSMEKMPLLQNGSAELFVDTFGPWKQPLFKMFSRNIDVRRATYRKIHEFMQAQGDTVGERHRQIKERYEKLSYFGWSTVGMRKAGWMKDNFTTHNLAVIKYFIDNPNPQLKVVVDSDKILLSILPWSMAGVKISYLTVAADRRTPPARVPVTVWGEIKSANSIEPIPARRAEIRVAGGNFDLSSIVRELEFITPLSAESQRVPRQYSILIKLETDDFRTGQSKIQLQLKNSITGEKIEKFKAELQFGSFSESAVEKSEPRVEPPTWLDDHRDLRVKLDEHTATIPAGEYSVERDLILPKGLKLVVEAGTTLRLAKDVAICGFDGIDVLGTREQPVVITAKHPTEPFGSIGILGNVNTTSNLNYLTVTDGFERWVNGIYFSGAMSLHYNGTVNLNNCTFANNHADDGLNVKYGKVVIADCHFQDNAADQIDLDLCQGSVEDSEFRIDARQDANGDGLDLSGSSLAVKRCKFNGFPDKGISIGEASRIQCRNNRFGDNTTGIAVKDASHAYLVDNQFRNNTVDLDAFQKKTMYSGGTIWFSQVPDDATQIYLDPKSKVFAATSLTAFAELVNANDDIQEPTSDWIPVSATITGDPIWRPAILPTPAEAPTP